MSTAILTQASFEAQAIGLLEGHAVMAVVAAGPPDQLAGAAWELARSAARTGRRTALVDCILDAPTLHAVVDAPNDTGIVDAFEYGASLSKIAQPTGEPGLFFIPGGTFAADPAAVLAHARWKRLSAGFRHEAALLLLFVSADGVAGLAADLDGMIVLAAKGGGASVSSLPGVAELMARGVDLVAVLGDEQPAAVPSPAAPEPHAPRPAPRRRASAPMAALLQQQQRSTPWGVYAFVLVAAVAAAGWTYRAEVLALMNRARGLAPDSIAAPAPAPAPPPPAVDSLPWAVQLAAWPDTGAAFAQADSVERLGVAVVVTPAEVRGRLMFRVQLGPAPSLDSARALLARLRIAGYTAVGAAPPAVVPLSLGLRAGFTPNQAQLVRARLRDAGVPVFYLGQADGRYRVYAGIFSDSAESVRLRNSLPPTDSAAVLMPRVGFVP